MAQMDIGRLTLKLSGYSAAQGERLARRVANRLAEASLPDRAGRAVEALRVGLTWKTGGSVDTLADQLAEAIVRELERMI